MSKPIEPTGETIDHNGQTLHRIRATQPINNCRNLIQPGTLGGFVANLDNIKDEAWVADNAKVTDNATITGHAYIGGNALIEGDATISDWAAVTDYARVRRNAKISGYATIMGGAFVGGSAEVTGHALVSDSSYVGSYAKIYGYAQINGTASVWGYAKVYESAVVSGNARVYGDVALHGSIRVHANSVINQAADLARKNDIIAIEPIGPVASCITAYRNTEGEVIVHTDEWTGRVDQMMNAMRNIILTYNAGVENDRCIAYMAEFQAACDLIVARARSWGV